MNIKPQGPGVPAGWWKLLRIWSNRNHGKRQRISPVCSFCL